MLVKVAHRAPEPARLAFLPRSGGRLAARIVLSDGQVVGPDAGVEVLVADADQVEALAVSDYAVPPADLDAR